MVGLGKNFIKTPFWVPHWNLFSWRFAISLDHQVAQNLCVAFERFYSFLHSNEEQQVFLTERGLAARLHSAANL